MQGPDTVMTNMHVGTIKIYNVAVRCNIPCGNSTSLCSHEVIRTYLNDSTLGINAAGWRRFFEEIAIISVWYWCLGLLIAGTIVDCVGVRDRNRKEAEVLFEDLLWAAVLRFHSKWLLMLLLTTLVLGFAPFVADFGLFLWWSWAIMLSRTDSINDMRHRLHSVAIATSSIIWVLPFFLGMWCFEYGVFFLVFPWQATPLEFFTDVEAVEERSAPECWYNCSRECGWWQRCAYGGIRGRNGWLTCSKYPGRTQQWDTVLSPPAPSQNDLLPLMASETSLWRRSNSWYRACCVF